MLEGGIGSRPQLKKSEPGWGRTSWIVGRRFNQASGGVFIAIGIALPLRS